MGIGEGDREEERGGVWRGKDWGVGEVELEGGVSQAVDTGGEQRSGEEKGEALENEDWV